MRSGAFMAETGAVVFFPVAIGSYDHFENLDVEREVDSVANNFAPFGIRDIDWASPLSDRGADWVAERLREWSISPGPSILYWVGHGWSDSTRARLAHSRSPESVMSDGISPAMLGPRFSSAGLNATHTPSPVAAAVATRGGPRWCGSLRTDGTTAAAFIALGEDLSTGTGSWTAEAKTWCGR